MAVPEVKRSVEFEMLPQSSTHTFVKPKKMINEGEDVDFFLTSRAYMEIVAFLLQLNASMFPRGSSSADLDTEEGQPDGEDRIEASPIVANLSGLLTTLDSFIEKAPPDPGPRRFGNVSFRKWYDLAEAQVDELLDLHVPKALVDREDWADQENGPKLELRAYLLGSFGSSQRLDYGTGHELSFLAFLGCIWKLSGFASLPALKAEKALVLGVVKPYLDLVRRLIITYNLEPAGSHGVWGLDDHSFLPFIFGSAQLAPPIKDIDSIPAEGSSPNAPDPGDVTNSQVVGELRGTNMYFGAIGFIYDVKKGPFWEHSPTLYDISGVKAGWAKINKGMIKMYIAEVLSKFPVVQHFVFGHMFRWERDPHATPPVSTEKVTRHTAAAPASHRLVARVGSSATAAPLTSAALSGGTATGLQAARPPAALDARRMPPPQALSAPRGAPAPQTKAPWARDR